MKNKIIFLAIVFLVLLGLLIGIKKNRTHREEMRMEEIIRKEKEQHYQDSLKSLQEVRRAEKSIEKSEKSEKSERLSKPKEDYSVYINNSIHNSDDNVNIAVTVVDENGNLSPSISSSIANVYNQSEFSGNTGLLRSSFLQRSDFQELFQGNSVIIENLNLSNYADYVAVGKIHYTLSKGTLVEGTFVCTVTLSMNIISTNQKTLVKSITYTSRGNGASEEQAEKFAVDKLLQKYSSDYSSI